MNMIAYIERLAEETIKIRANYRGIRVLNDIVIGKVFTLNLYFEKGYNELDLGSYFNIKSYLCVINMDKIDK